jgi:aminotransferase
LAHKHQHFTGLEIDPDRHLVVTCGSTEAMMCAMMTCCEPGDKVIVFSPFYENYSADAILSGAEPIYVPLHPPQFGFDPAALERAFAQGAKAIIVCNPSNPTGKVFTRQELQLILDLAEKYDAFVITDEPYEHIVYAPQEHVYMHSLPGASERVIVCNSLSKTYSITGWRLGYVQAAPHIIAQARKVHDFLTVGAAAPLQEAAVAGLELPDSYYHGLRDLYTAEYPAGSPLNDLHAFYTACMNTTAIDERGAEPVRAQLARQSGQNNRQHRQDAAGRAGSRLPAQVARQGRGAEAAEGGRRGPRRGRVDGCGCESC